MMIKYEKLFLFDEKCYFNFREIWKTWDVDSGLEWIFGSLALRLFIWDLIEMKNESQNFKIKEETTGAWTLYLISS